MKFEFVITARDKRLVLIPEDASEALLLGTVCDPNGQSHIDDNGARKEAVITVKASNDRVPYRKVVELYITL